MHHVNDLPNWLNLSALMKFIDFSCFRLILAVECTTNKTLDNGIFLSGSEKFYVNDTVEIRCDIGYVINTDSGPVISQEITCSQDGTWDSELPKCEGMLSSYQYAYSSDTKI